MTTAISTVDLAKMIRSFFKTHFSYQTRQDSRFSVKKVRDRTIEITWLDGVSKTELKRILAQHFWIGNQFSNTNFVENFQYKGVHYHASCEFRLNRLYTPPFLNKAVLAVLDQQSFNSATKENVIAELRIRDDDKFGASLSLFNTNLDSDDRYKLQDLVRDFLESDKESALAQTPPTPSVPTPPLVPLKYLSNINGYYPTPPNIARYMLKLAGIESGDRVVEPCAGIGSLASEIVNLNLNLYLICVESRVDLFAHLFHWADNCGVPVHCVNEDWFVYREKIIEYPPDIIIANPPWGRKVREGNRDYDHVRSYYETAKKRVVSLVHAGTCFHEHGEYNRFRHWLESVGAKIYTTFEDGSPITFTSKESGTNCSAAIVVIDKTTTNYVIPDIVRKLINLGLDKFYESENF